jgi:hypothetical protein
MTMLLYHGTAEKHLDAILRVGIWPRGKKKGNWGHTITSNPDNCYLTSAYAIYFAAAGVEHGEKLAVVEIDTARLNPYRLLPDEDFLEQATRKSGPAPLGKSMKVRTRWYRQRLQGFQQYWQHSVENMGTCSHEGAVPPDAITRIATIDYDAYIAMVAHGMDPTITLANFHACGVKYRNWLHWLFGDALEEDPSALHKFYEDPQRFAALPEDMRQIVERSRANAGPAVDRTGVAVFTPRERLGTESATA